MNNRKKFIAIFGTVVVFIVLSILFVIIFIPNLRYNKAIKLVSENDYLSAISLFQELDDYKDSKLLLNKTKKEYVNYLISQNSLDEAALYAEQNNILNENQLSALKRAAIISSGKYDAIVNGNVGDIVTFGKYIQSGLDPSPLEWIIIDKSGDNLFLISKYCLKRGMMGGKNWEEAEIRNEMNSSMINAMFEKNEQSFILETNNVSKEIIDFDYDNPTYLETVDKLFLLSADEAVKYFPTKTDRFAQPTEKCGQNYEFDDSTRNVTWATRDSSRTDDGAAYFTTVVYWADDPVERAPCGSSRTTEDFFIRPAMWITTNTDYQNN